MFRFTLYKILTSLCFSLIKVFSIISSCVRVDIDGVKSVYNCGEVFMIPSGEWKLITKYELLVRVFLISSILFDFCVTGQAYSIHNLCQEPAVLIYHRTLSTDATSGLTWCGFLWFLWNIQLQNFFKDEIVDFLSKSLTHVRQSSKSKLVFFVCK